MYTVDDRYNLKTLYVGTYMCKDMINNIEMKFETTACIKDVVKLMIINMGIENQKKAHWVIYNCDDIQSSSEVYSISYEDGNVMILDARRADLEIQEARQELEDKIEYYKCFI